MRRVVSLWLLTWPTDRLRRRPDAPAADRPLVVAAREGSRRLVVAADRVAQAQGLHAGMTVAQAQAMTPRLIVAAADPLGDAAALRRLARWCLRYAPIAAVDPPDAIVIDATGCTHLMGGEAALLDDVVSRLERAGITARAAIAGTWAAAWALARFAPPATIASGGSTAYSIARLPVAALRLGPDTSASLRRLGFERIADLEAAPRSSLALRFGPELTRRLDQAHGRLAEPIQPVAAGMTPGARLRFAEPIGGGTSLTAALCRLASRLCTDLQAAGAGARRLDLLISRVDRDVAALRVGTAQATRDPAHIARMFARRLDRIDPGFGIEAVALVASRTETLGARQLTTGFDDRTTPPDLGVLVDRIANRIGEQHLYRLAPVESDLPERTFRRVPALSPPVRASWAEGPRPVRLLTPPEPVKVTALLPDHPPALFVWRGRRRHVRTADGPERVFGEWWRSAAEVAQLRDYFRIEDEAGQRFWLFRLSDAHGARWFVHGIFA